MKKFPFTKQMDSADCGPACLKMIAEHYGKIFSLDNLRDKARISKLGVSMLGISEAAEQIGCRTTGVKIDFAALNDNAPLPCIVHWNQNHFVVVYKIQNNKVYVADPAYGLVIYSADEFLKGFLADQQTGLALFLTPTPKFYQQEGKEKKRQSQFSFLYSYLKAYRGYFIQLFIGMLAGSAILVIAPLLSQALVDQGIIQQNLGFVYVILIAQLMLFLGNSFIQLIRSWILLHVGTRINISIISDFLMKLLKLPMSFFNTKMMGDILQRVEDHERIKRLLTVSTLMMIFSFFNIFLLGALLFVYNRIIFAVFAISSIVSTLWIMIFLKKRKELDFKMFNQQSLNRGKLIHIIEGIEEIKNSNSDKQKRWEWENIQAKLFKINVKSLSVDQFQSAGSSLIIQLEYILISILAARAVIYGEITLGVMMAITFIVGQLNAPLQNILSFILIFQDAKIGLERINEIHQKEEEDASEKISVMDAPAGEEIVIKDLCFSYSGSQYNLVLKNLNLVIPAKKITAIVGASGSGKTTLMKLLLKYFCPIKGQIFLGQTNFENIHSGNWRNRCGVVLQDGYIFSDTIANNVALGELVVDFDKLERSLRLACIDDFVFTELPLKHLTKIGEEGLGLSRGQVQRLLLARAIYKQPAYIFLDEATSSLDADLEKRIMDNLTDFFRGKTVVIIAHRLSTVKNADKIIVLDQGRITEEGTHQALVEKRQRYYHLIKNQLELGE
jgi:ATP-binding cassette subfamily B protein